jgi:hypothetical protein
LPALGGSLAPHPGAPAATTAPRTRPPCQARKGDPKDDRKNHFDRVQRFMAQKYRTPPGNGESILEGSPVNQHDRIDLMDAFVERNPEFLRALVCRREADDPGACLSRSSTWTIRPAAGLAGRFLSLLRNRRSPRRGSGAWRTFIVRPLAPGGRFFGMARRLLIPSIVATERSPPRRTSP